MSASFQTSKSSRHFFRMSSTSPNFSRSESGSQLRMSTSCFVGHEMNAHDIKTKRELPQFEPMEDGRSPRSRKRGQADLQLSASIRLPRPKQNCVSIPRRAQRAAVSPDATGESVRGVFPQVFPRSGSRRPPKAAEETRRGSKIAMRFSSSRENSVLSNENKKWERARWDSHPRPDLTPFGLA